MRLLGLALVIISWRCILRKLIVAFSLLEDIYVMDTYKILAVLLLCCCISFGAAKSPIGEAQELKIAADNVSHEQASDTITAEGNVRIDYGDITMTAQKVTLNRGTMDFKALGDVKVSLANDGGKWQSQAILGNLEKRQLFFGPYRMSSPVWHGGGEDGGADGDGNVTSTDVWLSTCDKHEPHYRISASTVNYFSNHTFSAKNAILRFGNVPVFYFPYIWGTTDSSSGYIVHPGYSGKKGAYLRLGRVKKFNDKGEGNLYLDLMAKRGVGVGSDIDYNDGNRTMKSKLYGILDSDPPETEHGYDRRFKSRDERYRVNAYFREELDEGLDMRLNVDVLSDISMLSDWFKRDYNRVEQPRSYLDLNMDTETFSTGIGIRPRLNDFYTTVETLPEYRFDMPRKSLGDTSFQHQSSIRIGYYSMKWRNFDRKRFRMFNVTDPLRDLVDDPNDYESFRANLQHFIYRPIQLGTLGSFTPRAGLAATYYSRSSKTKMTDRDIANLLDVDDPEHPYTRTLLRNYDAKGGEVARLAFEFGAEWKANIQSDWVDWKLEKLNLNGAKHIIEPYINYTYAHDPSHNRDHIYFFDELDRLDRQHFIRFGIDQRLITRRNQGTSTYLRLQSYYDFHFDRGEESGRHPGDLGNKLDFTPRDDLAFWAALVYDAGEYRIQRGEGGVRFGKKDDLNFSARYVFRNDHMSRSVWSMGSSLADFSGESSYLKKRFESADVLNCNIFIPLNTLTSLEIEAEYDFDKSKLSEHKYTLRRRMHCWDVGFGFGWDNNDFEVVFMARLVAFPKVRINVDF